MNKRFILALGLALAGVISSSTLFAQNYNNDELKNLRDFLIIWSGHEKPAGTDIYPYNYQILAPSLNSEEIDALNSADDWKTLTTWMGKIGGVTFTAGNRIQTITWNNDNAYNGLGGVLNLADCSELVSIDFPQNINYITSITLNGSKLTNANLRGSTTDFSTLTSLTITSVTTTDENGFPSLLTGYGKNLGIDCEFNRLTFANMPPIRVITDGYDFNPNLFLCANQAPSEGNEDPLNKVDLHTNYWVDTKDYFGGTEYKWYYVDGGGTISSDLYSQDGYGIFTFDSSLEDKSVYCEMTNNLFSVKSDPPCYETNTDGSDINLILRYYTTLVKSPDTGISSPGTGSAVIYLTDNTLYVKSEASPVQAVAVFDLSGKQVFGAGYHDHEVTVDASGWQRGVYIVKVNTIDGSASQKIIK
ncbi:MAG: T9SS type A sorting domain-containing protein [Candidatus Azobacteroides sp.]|nr:T9SS type A sorting domain-containing protein [Candidatus Azobacteroides sp.]